MKSQYYIVLAACLGMFSFDGLSQQTAIMNDTTQVYDNVEQLPYIKGHRKTLTKYIQENSDYPAILKLKGVEGLVIVGFVVDEKGKIQSAHVEKGEIPELNELALATIIKSGPWIPGKINRLDVATRMSVPISFQLNSDEQKMMEALKPIDFDKKPPLFILDGKMVDGIINLDFYNVKSIRVIKGANAVDHYGERAQFGVVEITSKHGTPPVRSY